MEQSPSTDLEAVVDQALVTARRWLDDSKAYPENRAAKLLASVLKDPAGLDFTVSFVDGVIRPEDLAVAGRRLAELARRNPRFLPAYLRVPMHLGGAMAPAMPQIVVPAARRAFAALVGDLVVDVSGRRLDQALARLKGTGARLNVNLLGEAVLGDEHADARLADTLKLLKRPDVDYVSVKVSAVTGPHNPWAFNETVARAIEQLLPLYRFAATSLTPKFINLDMEEYRDLHLTLEVFTQLLDRPELKNLEAGIVLQAYLPDSFAALQQLQNWAAQRRAAGGARVKVRIVKGANLAMERVESTIRDWPQPVWGFKQATDANYLRLLDWAFTPDRIDNVRVGAASHNVFTQATVWELAGLRGVRAGVELEMLSGMATQQASAIAKEVGELLLYVPVVRRNEYDVAISYLVRRLEENSAPENFMASIFDIGDDPRVFEKEKQRYLAAVKQYLSDGNAVAVPNRQQNRGTETRESLSVAMNPDGEWGFRNTPDSDASLPANIDWATQVRAKMADSSLGAETTRQAMVASRDELDAVIAKGVAAAAAWRERPASERAEIVHQVGVELGLARGDLLAVAGGEAGKAIDQTDAEVSEAIDFAHYYAERASQLDAIPGASFCPVDLTVVTPPWNFPLSIPLGGVTAALAAGSAVLLKPASPTRRCGAMLAQACWRAGVPADVLQLVNLESHDLGQQLVTDPRVGAVVLTGSAETAQLFRSWRPDLKLMAETSGKNAIIVTASADLDLAVQDVVSSAFGHAGQKCSAASLVILVGSAAKSRRFRDQLRDAVASLHVAWPSDASAQMSPLTEAPGEKLMAGLTSLEPGQSWLLRPKKLDDTGRLWSPGIRTGVMPGSDFHLIEYFGPVLGAMVADTLSEAIEWQNAVAFGLTGGLHSLDPDEIDQWLCSVQVGNAYVNRSITGAIVRRQPFGGWKRSSVGTGTKAGGPNYLFGFGTWTPQEPPASIGNVTKPQLLDVLAAAQGVLDKDDQHKLAQAVRLDELAARTEFDLLHDPSRLEVEKNLLRYQPMDVTIRFAEHTPLWQVFREVSAAVATGEYRALGSALTRRVGGNPDCLAKVQISTSEPLPVTLEGVLRRYDISSKVESDAEFTARARHANWGHDGRIRLVGGDAKALADALNGSIDVAIFDGEVLPAGRLSILPYVHEQALSLTNHRFGNRTPILDNVCTP